MIHELIETMRPMQWYKNLVLFVALIFAKEFLNLSLITISLLAFASFCLLSSGSYVVNDIIDAEADRNHDKKKLRPIASGRLGKATAAVFAVILYLFGFSLAYQIGINFFLLACLLFLSVQTYNIFAKNIPFLDVSLLSSNFMIRAIAGALAINVRVSSWLILGTFFFALFLSISKRKVDLISLDSMAVKYKKVFEVYTVEILNGGLLMAATLTFIAYCLYLVMSGALYLPLAVATIPLAFYLVFRYYSAVSMNKTEVRDPEKIFNDKSTVIGMVH